MNWYRKAQINKEAKGLWTAFGFLTVPAIALLLGLPLVNVEDKIKENPQELVQQVQQAQQIQQQEPQIQQEQNSFETNFQGEYQTIIKAAQRNNLAIEDYPILFAIRKSENGGRGREFGIIHPRCEEQMKANPDKTLDIQAGWAANTIRKNRERWEAEGRPTDFITYLGKKYAPIGVKNDPNALNVNWISNVNSWVNRLGQYNQ